MKKTITILMVILCIHVVWNADGKGSNAMAEDRFEQGYQQMKKTNPDGTERVLKSLSGVAPDMARFLVAFAYGDIYSRPALNARTREIATVAILTALGSQSALKWHINAALTVGVTPQEIIDTIYVQTVYSGFPAGLNAISAACDVFKERKVDFKPTKLDNDKVNRRERGLRTLDETSKGAGMRIVESMADIAPDMADFLIAIHKIMNRTGPCVHLLSNILLQTIVEDNKRGRVMSFFAVSFMGMAPLGSLMAGTLAGMIGITTPIMFGGICCIAGAIFFARILSLLRSILRPIYADKGIVNPD